MSGTRFVTYNIVPKAFPPKSLKLIDVPLEVSFPEDCITFAIGASIRKVSRYMLDFEDDEDFVYIITGSYSGYISATDNHANFPLEGPFINLMRFRLDLQHWLDNFSREVGINFLSKEKLSSVCRPFEPTDISLIFGLSAFEKVEGIIYPYYLPEIKDFIHLISIRKRFLRHLDLKSVKDNLPITI